MSIKPRYSASYWEEKTFLSKPNLVIIGSGIVGLSSALEVKKRNPDWKVLVIDRGSLPFGASTKNAGFACFGSPSELLADIDQNGWDRMIALVRKRWEGLKKLRELVSDSDMDYQHCGGFEVFNKAQSTLLQRCSDTLPQLNEALSFIGADVFQLNTDLQNHGLQSFAGIVHCPYEASINPGLMMQSLIDRCHAIGIQFLNGLEVNNFQDQGDRVVVQAEGFEVETDFLLLATNAFTPRLIPELDIYPGRNQVIVTSPINNLRLKGIYHHDCGYVYFRTVEGNRILLGGARNHFDQQERTDEMITTTNVIDHLRYLLRELIIPGSDFKIDYQWSGILGLGAEKTPIIQWKSDRIFVACRMGGMGISIGAHIGQSAAQEIIAR